MAKPIEKKSECRLAGTLRFVDVNTMTESDLKFLAKWLRKNASDLIKRGAQYAKRFRSRCFLPNR